MEGRVIEAVNPSPDVIGRASQRDRAGNHVWGPEEEAIRNKTVWENYDCLRIRLCEVDTSN